MNVIDLADDHLQLYFMCLEDWSEEIKEAGTRKELWYKGMVDKGLRVKLALDDGGQVGGMIQYGPIEHSFADGNDLYIIYCIWVHGHKQGRGNFQKKGMGKALLRAAEDDARDRGAQGMAAWGMFLPFWMKASWFKKQGYSKVDRQGLSVLLWKPFTDTVKPPRWIKQKKKPETVQGKVTVTAFVNGWCQVQNMVYERAKRAAAEFGDEVVFREIDTSDRDVLMEWGLSDALYIDDKQVRTGPPPSYEKIYKLISKRVGKLNL
ncbi:MAG: GNAT family N-acetyltransferase [Methanosarcinales archaeon]|nr:GNAT family N-acetyltransferase [Methanosarcinales archaeon]